MTSLALALAPLSLIAPIGGLKLVFGACFAWIGIFGVQKERITIIESLGLLLTIAGVTVAAIFGPYSPPGSNLRMNGTRQSLQGDVLALH